MSEDRIGILAQGCPSIFLISDQQLKTWVTMCYTDYQKYKSSAAPLSDTLDALADPSIVQGRQIMVEYNVGLVLKVLGGATGSVATGHTEFDSSGNVHIGLISPTDEKTLLSQPRKDTWDWCANLLHELSHAVDLLSNTESAARCTLPAGALAAKELKAEAVNNRYLNAKSPHPQPWQLYGGVMLPPNAINLTADSWAQYPAGDNCS